MNRRRTKLALLQILGALSLFGAAEGSHALAISTTFSDFDTQNFGVSGSQTLDFTVTNDTGVTWTDFHIASVVIGPFSPTSYVGPGTGVFSTSNFELDIFDLSVADSGLLSFSVDYVCGIAEVCALGTVIAAFPTTDGTVAPVPEPGTITLLLAGLLGLAAVGRRMRRG